MVCDFFLIFYVGDEQEQNRSIGWAERDYQLLVFMIREKGGGKVISDEIANCMQNEYSSLACDYAGFKQKKLRDTQ